MDTPKISTRVSEKEAVWDMLSCFSELLKDSTSAVKNTQELSWSLKTSGKERSEVKGDGQGMER